jgi:hypothetical protein
MSAKVSLSMRFSGRRVVSLLAIYAVALNLIFLGLASVGANANVVDPFSVICHSIAGTHGNEAPGQSGLIPGHACEHCNLCSVVAPPPAPDVALNVEFRPARILQVLRPASTETRAGLSSDPRLARGPPQTA